MSRYMHDLPSRAHRWHKFTVCGVHFALAAVQTTHALRLATGGVADDVSILDYIRDLFRVTVMNRSRLRIIRWPTADGRRVDRERIIRFRLSACTIEDCPAIFLSKVSRELRVRVVLNSAVEFHQSPQVDL